jgi:multiple sugar transport system substrate-binding protein
MLVQIISFEEVYMKRAFTFLLSLVLVLGISLPSFAAAAVPLKAIKVASNRITMKVGQTSKLAVVLSPANTTEKQLTYSSGDSDIAKVDKQGQIIGTGVGTTSITVNTPNKAISMKIYVVVNPQNSEKTKLTFFWWGTQVRHDLTIKAIDFYKQRNPYVTVEPLYQGYDGYYQKLSILAASNNMPDVFQDYIGSTDTNQYIEKNMIEPLNDYIGAKLIKTSDISMNSLSTGTYNGKLYGISLGANARAMVVDLDLLQKAGISVPTPGFSSWADMEKVLPVLKTATGAYAMDDPFTYANGLPYYCRQMGETIYTDGNDGKNLIRMSEKTYVDFYNMKLKWIKNGWIPPFDVSSLVNTLDDTMLAKKKAAITYAYSNQFDTALAKTRNLKLVLMPGPNADKGMDIRAGIHMSMSKSSKNRNEAALFMHYIINDIEANKILNAQRGMPVNSRVREALKPTFNTQQQAIADYLDLVGDHSSPVDPPAPSGTTQLDTLLKDLEQQIAFEKTTPKDAYKKLVEMGKQVAASTPVTVK